MKAIRDTKYATGQKGEALLVLPDLDKLANEILSEDELKEADEISVMLIQSKKKKRAAIGRLREVVGDEPYRPLHYVSRELDRLPIWTRNPIRYLGDYVDLLVKHLAFQLTKDPKVSQVPMGTSIFRIRHCKEQMDETLLSLLEEYNRIFYVPAKHDFNLPDGRKEHRFTSKEVVLTAFVSIRVGAMIKNITHCNSQLSCHTGEELEYDW